MAPYPIPVANTQVTLGGGSTEQAGEGPAPRSWRRHRGAAGASRSPTPNPCPAFWSHSSQDVTLLLEGYGVALPVPLTGFPKDPSSPHARPSAQRMAFSPSPTSSCHSLSSHPGYTDWA